MKLRSLPNFVGASVLALSLAVIPSTFSASAQTNSAPTTNDNTTTNRPTATENTGGDRDFDWGWLGLIGLAGLAGLARRHEEPEVRYREPSETTSRSNY